MDSVAFVETSTDEIIHVNPKTVETLRSNSADDDESTQLTLTSGKTLYVNGSLDEVRTKLKTG